VALAAPLLEPWDRGQPGPPLPAPSVAVPVRVNGALLGVLVAYTLGCPVSAEDLAALRAYAALAVPLAASLSAEEEAGRSRLERLSEIARAVVSGGDARTLLREVCLKTARLCDADRCAVFLWNAATGEVTPATSQMDRHPVEPGAWERFKRMGRRRRIDGLPHAGDGWLRGHPPAAAGRQRRTDHRRDRLTVGIHPRSTILMKSFAAALTVLALFLVPAVHAADQPWSALSFLIGDWDGSGSGQPGQGAGSFSFTPDLQNQVLVRRSHSEYPAASGRPATVHVDLTVVYDPASPQASYFDNEGHVIHYAVTVDPAAHTAVFTSDGSAPGPGFRLTYKQTAADQLKVTFEISPTGKAADFKTYLDGTATRRPATHS
jgi:hypothetical protein